MLNAVKIYYKEVILKLNKKWFHVLLLILLHMIVVSWLESLWAIVLWTLAWIVTVPPFCGWYIAVYRDDKDIEKEI